MGSLGERLRKLREKRGLKQKEVAEFLQLNPNTYCRYEKGERTPPPEIIAKLAEFLGVTTDYLLTGKVSDNGHKEIPWWEKDEPPSDVELWEFIQKHSNLKLMGYPIDEEAKKDILLALRTALEYIKKERKREKKEGRQKDGQ